MLRRFVKLVVVAGAVAAGYALWRRRRQARRHADAPGPGVAPPSVDGPAPARRPGAGTKPGGPPRPDTRKRGERPGAPPPPELSDRAVTHRPGHAATEAAAWVEPNVGSCPLTHPVKANMKTKVFHLPGGSYYDRVDADRCYRDADAARADGLRPSKR